MSHRPQTDRGLLVFPLSAICFPNTRHGFVAEKCRSERRRQPDCQCVQQRHVLCVVSRLQGDSLSDNRSEEDRRPHISEQAVPDISCRFAQHGSNSAALYIVVLGFFFFFLTFWWFNTPSALVLLFLFVCDVWFSSIVRFGHGGGAAAGMRGLVSSVNLCEYPPHVRHHTIKIALQPPITASLPLHSRYCLDGELEKGGWGGRKSTSSNFLIGQAKHIFVWPLLAFTADECAE